MDITAHPPVNIRKATLDDLEILVDLHYKSFTPREHLGMLWGRRFIHAVYHWLIDDNANFTIVAETGGCVVGMTNVSDSRYDTPMFLHTLPWVLLGFLKKPWLLLHPAFLERLMEKIFLKKKAFSRETEQTANLAFIAVDISMRDHGIGHKLLEAAKNISRERGNKLIWTRVYKINTASIRAFEKSGFKSIPDRQTSTTLFMKARLGIDDQHSHNRSIEQKKL